MIKSLETTGRTEDEAIAAALKELGLERDDVSVTVVERAKSGFLGIGASPAVVRVEYEAPDEPEVEAEPAPVEAEAPVKAAEKSVDDGEFADIRAFLAGLLERMGVKANIEISRRDGKSIAVNLSGANMGAVIGRRGETLDAIQHLTNYVINRGSDKHMHICVDAESYRAKREESLVRLAEKMAAKVIKYKRSMALEPMNSYERHIIHAALQDYEGVTTSSTGTEPNRRVVVSYDRPQNNGNKPQSREWSLEPYIGVTKMILEKIQQILAQQFEVSADSINADTNIVDDLGADSLDVVELIMSVEDEFGVQIPDEDAAELATVGKIIEYIEARQ